jgi:hypothetical protein
VYLTAAVPDAGDSMVSLMSAAAVRESEADEEGVTFREDGLAVLDPEAARRALFNDCAPDRAEEGLARLRPTNMAGADPRWPPCYGGTRRPPDRSVARLNDVPIAWRLGMRRSRPV